MNFFQDARLVLAADAEKSTAGMVWLLVVIATTWICVLPVRGQALPLKPFSYQEIFEGKTLEVKMWAHNGTMPKINAIEPTEARSREGRKSLKIDITLGTGNYAFFGMPVRVPCVGKLRLSARLLFAEGPRCAVGFGANIVYPPSKLSAYGEFKRLRKPQDE